MRKEQQQKGLKYDNGKDRWDLLPLDPIAQIVKVLTFGAVKYTDNSWQQVENGVDRYYSALMRHIHAWRSGEKNDQESGLSHLSHAFTNIMFIIWLEANGSSKKDKSKGN